MSDLRITVVLNPNRLNCFESDLKYYSQLVIFADGFKSLFRFHPAYKDFHVTVTIDPFEDSKVMVYSLLSSLSERNSFSIDHKSLIQDCAIKLYKEHAKQKAKNSNSVN